ARPAFAPEVFRSRYLQLARWDRLSDEGAERLGRILAVHPELEAAWRCLQHLYGIHLAEDDQGANRALGAFIAAYESEPLPEFGAVIEALLKWGDEIFAFHDADRVTNGRLEGTNAKLGVLKRIAYGFVNHRNFGHRALLLCPAVA
ncbi:MAG: ISL3 family transposase, partial [Actinomycetota bacterium]